MTNDLGKIILLSGAILGFLIGSGVATGQEIMQYYTPYGYETIGTAITIAVILIVANYGFAYAGKHGNIEKGSDVFKYYCGPWAGKVFDYFTIVFCYLSYVVMIGGASSTLQQQYGAPLMVGGIIMMLLATGTVAFGLNNTVKIIGRITPLLILLIVSVCAIGLLSVLDAIPGNIAKINSGEIPLIKAADNWFLSGVSNGGFCILWLASFVSQLGKLHDFKLLLKGQVVAAIVLVIVNSIIGYALLGNIEAVGDLQIPNLYIAAQIWAPLANIFGILIFIAIYTTACPLLWTASSRFAAENTNKFRFITFILAALGLVIALAVPFNILMNYIYVINGYLGFILLLVMVVRLILMKKQAAK